MPSSLIQELLQGLCQFHLISRQIQRSMDGLSFSPGVEALLRPTQLSHIQPIVLPQKVLFHPRFPPTVIQIVTTLNLYCQITHVHGSTEPAESQHGTRGEPSRKARSNSDVAHFGRELRRRGNWLSKKPGRTNLNEITEGKNRDPTVSVHMSSRAETFSSNFE